MPSDTDSSHHPSTQEDVASLCAERDALKRVLQECLDKIIEDEKVGRVFHDFNNILSSSMGYANLALERADASGDDKLVRYLDNIERAGIRARDLVRDSLNSRRDARNAVTSSVRHMLSGCVGDVSDDVVDTRVHHSEAQLDMALRALVAMYERCGMGMAEQVEDFNCVACGEALRGSQVKVTVSADGRSDAPAPTFALVSALINSQGGHLCAALLQDEQFVVYLRAVISE